MESRVRPGSQTPSPIDFGIGWSGALRKVTSARRSTDTRSLVTRGKFWLKPHGGYFHGSIPRPPFPHYTRAGPVVAEYRRLGLVSSPLTGKATPVMQGTHPNKASRRIER